MSQVLTEQVSSAWAALLRAHSSLTRELNAQLFAEHRLTINDYEVMLHLSHAEGRRMRRVDLAEKVMLTPSGITRLLDGLERIGYVERAECASDRRVTYAVLTDDGLAKLRAASKTHLADVQSSLSSRLSDEELNTLAELLERLYGDGGPVSCAPE
jgi:DNA-binding MarR family transcriptional regulator